MTKIYTSILDQILDDLDPNPSEVGLKTEISRGDELHQLSRDKSDMGFLDDIAGDSEHTVIPHMASVAADWRGNSGRSLSGGGLLEEASLRMAGKYAEDVEKTILSDRDVKARISSFYHLGMKPSQVLASIEKLSELHAFNKGLATDVVKDMAGVVGYSYLEPNHFNDSCDDTKDKIKKDGKLLAKSVKKIAACDSCSNCKSGHCSLYRLPLVASAKELHSVITSEAARFGKTASKKTMADLHEGVNEQNYSAPSGQEFGRVAGFENIQREAEKVLTKEHIAAQVEALPLPQVFNNCASNFGKVAAKKAVAAYINGLRDSKAKVNLGHVDCKYLAGKLASGNAIIGSKKCASCVYRNCMSCGLTGGTLLSFPGMGSMKSSHRIAAGAKEGLQVLSEYEMESSEHYDAAHGDIDVTPITFDEVEASGSLDLE